MSNHGARAHAPWSASATSRNWGCSGSLTLAEQVAHLDRESEAAAWGTACHQISEKCLRNEQDAVEYIDSIEKTKQHEFTVDEEMADTAQTYIDYVRGRIEAYENETGDKALFFIEERFVLDAIKPPFEAGGTADTVLFFPKWQLLEPIDLKGGRGVKVEVNDNKQLRTYALGAALAHKGLDIQKVQSTIVQPRIEHVDGRIRSETYHIMDLVEWANELLKAMHRSKDAEIAYGNITGDITRDEWADKYLAAGDHCKFCPAAGFCPKLKKMAFDKVGLFFDDLDRPQLTNTPAELSRERLAQVLDAADMVDGFLSACRSLAHALADKGLVIESSEGRYILVDKIGRRRFKNKDNIDKLRADIWLATDLRDDAIFDKKPKSPAQIEKTLGKKRAHLVADLIETPKTGKNLVREDKTSRPAVAPAVHKHFDVIED